MKKKFLCGVGLIFIFVCFLSFQWNVSSKNEKVVLEKSVETKPKEISKKIYVDVKGAVLNPGVYECTENMNVMDVIQKSGGLLDTASTDYINLSKKLKDEMVIIIYTKEEISKQLEGETSVSVIDQTCICPKLENDTCISNENKITNQKEEKKETTTYPISLNHGTLEELMLLPGVGEKKAKDIIDYREKNHGFQTLGDLKQVKGIGDSTFEKLLPYITL